MDIVMYRGQMEALLLTINEMVNNLENRERRLTVNDQFQLDRTKSLQRFYISQINLIDIMLTRGVDR